MVAVPKWKLDHQLLIDSGQGKPWVVVSKRSSEAIAIFDRHYSRQTLGGEVGPPGRKLVLITRDGRALWCSHYPNSKLALDRLDSYRCVVFRNEGSLLSSVLIGQAVRATEEIWGPPPRDGWVTWVDTRKVASRNPGYCFQKAKWWRDREWSHKHLLRFRYP